MLVDFPVLKKIPYIPGKIPLGLDVLQFDYVVYFSNTELYELFV